MKPSHFTTTFLAFVLTLVGAATPSQVASFGPMVDPPGLSASSRAIEEPSKPHTTDPLEEAFATTPLVNKTSLGPYADPAG